jgi:hypothetical protein
MNLGQEDSGTEFIDEFVWMTQVVGVGQTSCDLGHPVIIISGKMPFAIPLETAAPLI